MKVSVVDLRYKTKSILEALDRNETVTILYHGKEKGLITPIGRSQEMAVEDHPFFGMNSEDTEPVSEVMDRIRGARV